VRRQGTAVAWRGAPQGPRPPRGAVRGLL